MPPGPHTRSTPFLWNVVIATLTYSGLSQHTYLTNKYNHLKEMRDRVTPNNNNQ